MKKRQKIIYISLLAIIFFAIFQTRTLASNSHDITPLLQGANGDTFILKGTLQTNSLKVGKKGWVGTIYLNGVIKNNTTKNGKNNPVLIGDDLRVDGAIYRTELGGSNPLKIADSLRPTANGEYSLGTSDARFKDAYFSGSINSQEVSATMLSTQALIGSGIVSSDNIADGAITAQDIANNAVTGEKIQDTTISTADLADSAVTGAKIADGMITADDIMQGAVTGEKILDEAIASADIATGGVTSMNIYDGTIVNADLADNTITSAKIADGTIGSSDLVVDFISGSQIVDGSILAADLADSIITSDKIYNGAITAADLADGIITADKIQDAAIGSADLADSAITSAKIADGTIIADDIASGAITSAKILDGTIASADIITGGVTSANIYDGTIANADISSSAAIAPSKLQTGSVGQMLVADNDGFLTFKTLTGDISSIDQAGNVVISPIIREVNIPLYSWMIAGTPPTPITGVSTPNFASVDSGQMDIIQWSSGETTQKITNVIHVPEDFSSDLKIRILTFRTDVGGFADIFSASWCIARDTGNFYDPASCSSGTINLSTYQGYQNHGTTLSIPSVQAFDVVQLKAGFSAIDNDTSIAMIDIFYYSTR